LRWRFETVAVTAGASAPDQALDVILCSSGPAVVTSLSIVEDQVHFPTSYPVESIRR
jgi:hypothetical protein